MGVWLGEKGKCVELNRPTERDGGWKGVGEVGNAGWREVKRVDGEEPRRFVEFDNIGWGMMFGGRLGYVMGKYSRDLLSSTVMEGRPR